MDGFIFSLDLSSPFNMLLKAVWEGRVGTVAILLEDGVSVDDALTSVSPLHVAVFQGYYHIVEALLQRGANVNYKCTFCGHHDTALHFAVQKGYRRIIELLLNYGANFNCLNKFGKTPLYLAAMSENYDIAEQLLQRGASPNIACSTKTTLLHHLVQREHEGAVRTLLYHGAQAEIRDSNGQTPLHLAVMSRNVGLVELLLSHGSNPNSRCKPKFTSYLHHTPLSLAAKYGDDQMFQVLLNHGANPHSRCQLEARRGVTILHYVAQLGRNRMVHLLLSCGANLNAKDSNGKTPLYYALKFGHPDTYQILLDRGAQVNNPNLLLALAAVCGRVGIARDLLTRRKANVNFKDRQDRTVLHRAIRSGNEDFGVFLIRNGIVSDRKDKDGLTPLHEAACKGMLDVMQQLVGGGSRVNTVDRLGNIPLHFAMKPGNEMIIRLLLDCGSDLRLANAFGRTPFYMAIETGSLPIIRLLLDHGANVNDICYYAGYEGNFTPLHLCVLRKMEDAAELLLSRGAAVNAKEEARRGILCTAVESGMPGMVDSLLKHGADVDETGDGDPDRPYMSEQERIAFRLIKNRFHFVRKKPTLGNTALHIAAMKGNTTIAEILLRHRARVSAKNSFGQTPLHYAAGNGNSGVVGALLKRGAVINAQNNAGKTALYLAAKEGSVACVRELLSYGADINVKDGCGRSALYIASERKREIIVALFLDFGPDITLSNLNKKTINNFLLYGQAEGKGNVLLFLIKHVLKLKAAGLHVSPENLQVVNRNRNESLQTYGVECEKEVVRMREENINGNVYMFDILIKPFDRIVSYVRNENIHQVLECFEYIKKYPIYGNFLECRFRRAKQKNALIDLATGALDNLLGFHLPTIVVHEVFSYVGVNDLVCLNRASERVIRLPREQNPTHPVDDIDNPQPSCSSEK